MTMTKRQALHQRQLQEYQKRVPQLQDRQSESRSKSWRHDLVPYVRYSKDHTGEVKATTVSRLPYTSARLSRIECDFLSGPPPEGFVLVGSDEDQAVRAAAEALPTPPVPYYLTCQTDDDDTVVASAEPSEEEIQAQASDTDLADDTDEITQIKQSFEVDQKPAVDPAMIAFVKEENERQAEAKNKSEQEPNARVSG